MSVMNRGAVIESFHAADDEQDIREKLAARGFKPSERVGDAITVTRASMKPSQIILFVVLIVVIVGLFVSCAANIFGGSGKKEAVGEGEAIYACELMVKDQLKAPASAKFSQQSASGAGTSWASRGTVDSQNSFGAMIRTTYSCKMTYSESLESWSGTATLSEQ
ncbi:hypothetical protein ACFY5D_03465 [Paeniglutamicibacter sp. NPDC012692]|uniref:hypothetical protein n=1 Tax=Paeniglutamicibacter sp. NPDC012692 TaxID=3364388 RepID=UPI0036744C59